MFMEKLRSLICPVLAAGTVIFSLGLAIMACPLKTPDFLWAVPVTLGSIVVIFSLGCSGARAERCQRNLMKLPDAQED